MSRIGILSNLNLKKKKKKKKKSILILCQIVFKDYKCVWDWGLGKVRTNDKFYILDVPTMATVDVVVVVPMTRPDFPLCFIQQHIATTISEMRTIPPIQAPTIMPVIVQQCLSHPSPQQPY